MKKFSSDFMIGAATAAHQVEGNNKHSDFWLMENIPDTVYKEPSLDAVDHYNKYQEDIELMAKAGLDTYRFSIEWARIEPSKGNFDQKEIEHYRDVLRCCIENQITPIVTLHHFSSPKWLILEGGWESEKTIEYFGKYCKYVVSELGDLIPYICTINEANMGKQINKIAKRMSHSNHGKDGDIQVGLNLEMQDNLEKYYRSLGEAFKMDPRKIHPFLSPKTENGELIIMKCHERAREVIKEINPNIKVGITLSLYDHQSLPGGEKYIEKEWNEDFFVYLPYIKDDDFLGVQNYSRKIHGPDGEIHEPENIRRTKMGYEFYPEGIGNVLRYLSKHWHKPMIVTENGISTDNDEERIEFIERALKGIQLCVEEGINVIGYLYWSLLDNFEWQLGYDQTFGLIAVDRATQKRYPKESLWFLGSIKN